MSDFSSTSASRIRTMCRHVQSARRNPKVRWVLKLGLDSNRDGVARQKKKKLRKLRKLRKATIPMMRQSWKKFN
eukprot:1485658-Amphidinium_carterae.1